MATKKELLEMLEPYADDMVVTCMDQDGGWDNIEGVESDGSAINIIFGGASPFNSDN